MSLIHSFFSIKPADLGINIQLAIEPCTRTCQLDCLCPEDYKLCPLITYVIYLNQ